MEHRIRRFRALSFLRITIGSAGWYTLWAFLFMLVLLMHPPVALGWIALMAGAFLVYPRLGPVRWRRRRAAVLWLRPLDRRLVPRVALAAILVAIAHSALSVAYGRILAISPPDMAYRFSAEPLGMLVIPALALVYAPLVEEFAWRGALQTRLTRLVGPYAATAVASLFFAAIHGSRAWLPFYFFGGLVFSYVFLVTRCIWGPVAVHFVINVVVTAGGALQPAWLPRVTVPSLAVAAMGLLTAAVLVLPPGIHRERAAHPVAADAEAFASAG